MKTASAKAKGRALQKIVRDAILRCFSSLTENDVRSTGMGQSGVDVQLSEAALKLFPYSVECKNVEKINLWQTIKQAEENVKPNTNMLIVIKRNREQAFAIIPFDHFMEMLDEKKTD